MKVYEYSPKTVLPRGSVIALGLFDGVHVGHRLLLETAKKTAWERGLDFTVFTFRSETLKKGEGALYSTEEKLSLIERLGVDAVILADFGDLSSVSAEDFAERLLIREMRCEVAVCGHDFRFGNKAAGNAQMLRKIMQEHGKECRIEEEHRFDGEKISTTKIKSLLGEGDVERARYLLGAPFFITGKVLRGRGEGRKLGFPTVNLEAKTLTHMKRGVYRCAVDIDGRLYSGACNVGTCPTFAEREVHAEVNLIDFDGEIYGENLRVFFLGFLREEIRFESAESLILQIKVDKNRVIKENGDITWQEIGLK